MTAPETPAPRLDRFGRIRIAPAKRSWAIPAFLVGAAIAAVGSLVYLDLPWAKLASRVPDLGDVFWKLGHLDFARWELILSATKETICVAVLSTFYGMLLGLLFGMLAAENVLRVPFLAPAIKAAFTFLRAVPTPVWVLLMMVCVGMGPAAGIAGLCVHTTAFFTRAFAQSFEDIPAETLEALEATGVGRIGVFLNAVLPSALARVVAWVGMRLEINVAECAILGMVGAGGVGFVIANGIQNYEYGSAGVAILLVFVMAYFTERLFVFLKRRLR